MIRLEGTLIRVDGAMTLTVAAALFAQGQQHIKNGATHVDLGAVTDVDSSGLSVLFAWLRTASATGRSLLIANSPANLLSLADVYGVADQLPLA